MKCSLEFGLFVSLPALKGKKQKSDVASIPCQTSEHKCEISYTCRCFCNNKFSISDFQFDINSKNM